MLIFQCNNCGAKKELMKDTINIIDGKVRTVEALCDCGEYMQEVEKDFNGFPNLIRTEPSLEKKNDKIWKGAKEKLLGDYGAYDKFDF